MVSREVFESLSNIAVIEGRGFVASEFFRNVSKEDGLDERNMIIENPSGSGVYVVLSAPALTSDRAVEYELIKNVSKDVAGTSVSTINQRTDGSDSAHANVEYNVEYSGGVTFTTEQSPGGQFQQVGFQSEDSSVLIAPGGNALIRIQNVSAATIDLDIQFSFGETLEKNIPPAWSP